MKKMTALILALVMALSMTCAMADTLTMCTNASFPPYEFVDGDKVVGIDAEIAAAVAEKLGYDLEIMDIEFSACIPALVSGKASFCMAGMTVTEERKQSVDFSDSYATGVQVVIVKEDSTITSVDDLFAEGAKHVVGVQESTTGDIYVTGDLEDAGLGTVNRYQNGNDAVMALLAGKVDCVVIDNEPAKAYVAANAGLKILETEYIVEEYAAAFPKGSDLLEKFNAALAELKADGTLDAIVAKYINAD